MLRLCLCVEVTAKHGRLWQQLLEAVLSPVLAYLEAAALVAPCEVACVIFGAHPPYSPAAVESTMAWCSDVAKLRQLLEGLQFIGGGSQPVALAEALLEAAALFALPTDSGGGPAPAAAAAAAVQQHCLVCLASDPAVRPVPWPFSEDCGLLAKLPGLATSAELCGALRRRGIQLGLVACKPQTTSPQFLGSQMLWHVANMISDTPLSLEASRLDQLKQHQNATLQQLQRSTAIAPGGSTAFLPFWPQALQAVIKAGAKPMTPAAALGAGRSTAAIGEPAGNPATSAGGAGTAAAAPSPATQPLQSPPPVWTQPTPSAAMQATPPFGAAFSPGSFLEVMGAEISPAGMMPETQLPPTTQQLQAVQQQQQLLSPQQQHRQGSGDVSQGPAVAGLPLPPTQQQQLQPAAGAQALAPDAAGAGSGAAGAAGAQLTLIRTMNVLVDQKVTRLATLQLGAGQIFGMPQDVAALRAMSWPSELRMTKTLALKQASAFLASRPNCRHTQLKIVQYPSREALNFLELVANSNAVGIVTLCGGDLGVLLPSRHPTTQQLLMQLVVVPFKPR